MLPRLNLNSLQISPSRESPLALTSESGSFATEKNELSKRVLYLGATSPNSLVICSKASPTLVRIFTSSSSSSSSLFSIFLSPANANSRVSTSNLGPDLHLFLLLIFFTFLHLSLPCQCKFSGEHLQPWSGSSPLPPPHLLHFSPSFSPLPMQIL